MCIRESISRISTRWMEPKAFLRSVNAIYSGRLLAFALSKIELSDNIIMFHDTINTTEEAF